MTTPGHLRRTGDEFRIPGGSSLAMAELAESHGRRVLDCDVGRLPAATATVDALARLQLALRRHGCELRLRGASRELCELVDLMGLRDVLRCDQR